MDIAFCPATAADAAYLEGLNERAYRELGERHYGNWDSAYQRQRFRNKLASASFRLIQVDGVRVGAVWTLEQDGFSVLRDLILEPEHQRQGIGSRVLALVTDEADRARMPMRLHTLVSNAAQRLYLRHAFVETRRDEDFVDMARDAGGWRWRFAGSRGEGDTLVLHGEDVWRKRWRPIPGLVARSCEGVVISTAWPVYELEPQGSGGELRLFAAGELSANVWGFALPSRG